MKKQLLLFVMMLLPIIASAEAVLINGLFYNLTAKSKTAEVTRDPSVPNVLGCYSGDIVIPNKVNHEGIDYDVTSIGDNTFSVSYGITTISIPNSITTIGSTAFASCTGLKSITIPNSVTSIGSYAFHNCTNLESITLSNGITSISGSLFLECTNLISVNIPEGVTQIGSNSFNGCTKLESIILPSTATTISFYAFYGCEKLTSITIPNNVTYIWGNAFNGCSKLSTVTLGTKVNNLGTQCFANCGELAHVYCLAENVPSTSADAFENSFINLATLHVPSASVAAYSAADVWKDFQSVVANDGTFHQLTLNVGKNGTVTYSGQQVTKQTKSYDILEGSNVQLTIAANAGHEISSLTVNGVDATGDLVAGVLTINNVTANTTVAATFAPTTASLAVTLTADMGTLCAADDLDFTNVAGLSAYIGSGFNSTTGVLTMTRVYDVPAGTGLVLVGTAGDYDIPYAASPSVYANLLKGVTENTVIWQTDLGNTNYVLANGGSGVGFYKVDNFGQLAAGKAYLSIPSSSSQTTNAPVFIPDFQDGTTGIKNIEKQNDGSWFDLQGRRISTPTKAGIYLNNGRKVVVR